MNIRTLTLMLAGLAMLGPFATDTYLPSFHSIGEDFQISQALVQQTLSIYLSTFAFMSLFYGTFSDSFGRRPVILFSLILFAIGSVGAMLAPSFGWLLFFRGLQGASAGAGRVVGMAIVRDKYHGAEAQRLFANITMVFSLAPAIAPVVGGYANSLTGWRGTFGLMVIIVAILIAMCVRWLPETLTPEHRQPLHVGNIFRNYIKALMHPPFLLAILAVGFAFSGFALYISSAASFIMNILGLPDTAFAWLFLPFISGVVIGSMFSSRNAGRIAPALLIRAGLGIMTLGAVLNVLYNAMSVAAVPWAVIPIFVYAVGMSVALPGMTVVTLGSFPSMRGLASSLQSFVQMFIFALVSGLLAPLLFHSALLLALGMGCSAVLCISLWWFSMNWERLRGGRTDTLKDH
ncbi:multidrug effflux MFS transporter [Pusillimonas sp. ANT_WB101]|uniref:multidrug effflux MFS transporter n=1 Tax=Pusillimonas sp. ANT_WB101 TaxID=2597356 RepID=UPI0011ED9B98|nr:multidrug effflux MFS transporter [Pusillimonas sp. ANT_WB101]KAA0889582.1 multidrug effflux MFS transporter [Pusillimonas sp. ANT_WB101]